MGIWKDSGQQPHSSMKRSFILKMKTVFNFIGVSVLLAAMFACASGSVSTDSPRQPTNIPLPQSYFDADATLDDIVQRIESTIGGGSTNQNSSSTQITQGGTQPRWVNDPYAVYARDRYIAAVGSAGNRDEAQRKALSALVAIFGQSVRSDFSAVTMYTEAINRGIVTVSENNRVRDEVSTAVAMDTLIGAEIGNVWDNGRGTVYAAAYMEKEKTISIYSDLIILNNRNIELLTAMSDTEKNTLDGYARYKLAALISTINSNYSNLILLVGGSVALLNVRNANYFNIEASNIIKNITVAVNVNNDVSNRIQDAFASVLTAEGLRTRGNNPLYTLEVRTDMSEVTYPNNSYIYCRFTVSANLVENATGAVLFPFNFTDREGHTTYANAQARAVTLIERTIAAKYPDALREYLASLLPLN